MTIRIKIVGWVLATVAVVAGLGVWGYNVSRASAVQDWINRTGRWELRKIALSIAKPGTSVSEVRKLLGEPDEVKGNSYIYTLREKRTIDRFVGAPRRQLRPESWILIVERKDGVVSASRIEHVPEHVTYPDFERWGATPK